MKKLAGILSLSTLFVVAACGNENVNNDEAAGANDNEANNAENVSEENEPEVEEVNEETNENESENSENEEDSEENIEEDNEAMEEVNEELDANEEEAVDEIAEDGWETQVGETVENEGGIFILRSRQDDIDTVETGPVVMEIPQVNASSGELSPDLAEMMETEDLEYIQMDVEVENTSDEDITFYVNQVTVSTNTGEQLEADFWMSDYIDSEMMAGTSHSGSFFFILENSNAEDIESIRAVWSAPINEDWDELGEEVDIDIEF